MKIEKNVIAISIAHQSIMTDFQYVKTNNPHRFSEQQQSSDQHRSQVSWTQRIHFY